MKISNLLHGPQTQSRGSYANGDPRGEPRPEETLLSGIHRALNELPALFRSLAADFSDLIGLKAALLKAEVTDSVKHYSRDALFLGIAGAVALITVPLLEITLALLIAWALPLSAVGKLATGFAVVTILNAVAAGVLLKIGLSDLKKRSASPKRTLKDFERDKEWLANGLK